VQGDNAFFTTLPAYPHWLAYAAKKRLMIAAERSVGAGRCWKQNAGPMSPHGSGSVVSDKALEVSLRVAGQGVVSTGTVSGNGGMKRQTDTSPCGRLGICLTLIFCCL